MTTGVGAMLAGSALALGVVLVLFVASWAIGRHIGRYNVVDVTWGLGFVAVAVTTFVWARCHSDATTARQWLVLALIAVWGLRLAAYIGLRSRGHGEDPRYDAMLARAKGSRDNYALAHVFLLQAATAWFVSLPVQVAMVERSGLGPLAVVGVVLWVIGVGFEAGGDAQMAAFKRDPANRGKVMDRGLWRYTRHPNYFGDACLWTGLYLIAAQQWIGAVTILSPIAMVYFVAAKTGKPMLERMMLESKPGYADYVRRTSGFFPLPPRTH
jgi:steroid 5-alpha reductase family enzyme